MRTITSVLCLSVLLLGNAVSADSAVQLRNLMTVEEINAMGLGGLTEQQQERLVKWILAFDSGQSADSVSTAKSTLVDTPSAAKDINAADKTTATAAVAKPVDAPASPPATHTSSTSASGNFGRAPRQPDEMRSRIMGTFTGWTGDTEFVLENGQVWRQRYETRWKTEIEDPEIVIKRRLFGLHRMEIVGTGKSVPVTRIK